MPPFVVWDKPLRTLCAVFKNIFHKRWLE